MATFPIHTLETAPEAARPALEKVKQKYGGIPNLTAELAEAPIALEAYLSLTDLLMKSSFTPTERNVVWFTFNFENNCEYCMAAHTVIANSEKVDAAVIEAARSGEPYADARLEALRQFSLQVLRQRGWVSEEDVQAFLDAGYTKQQILEVIVVLAHKTISNYVNHLAETPVDKMFAKHEWKKPAGATAN